MGQGTAECPAANQVAGSWAVQCVYFVIANVGVKTKLTFQDLSDGDSAEISELEKNNHNNLGIRNLLFSIAYSFRLFVDSEPNLVKPQLEVV